MFRMQLRRMDLNYLSNLARPPSPSLAPPLSCTLNFLLTLSSTCFLLSRSPEKKRRNVEETLRSELNKSSKLLAEVCQREEILKSKRSSSPAPLSSFEP